MGTAAIGYRAEPRHRRRRVTFVSMKTSVLIGLGAAAGAVTRALVLGVPGPDLVWLLVINAVGSLLMGWAKPGETIGVGFLGGFTSFSSFIAYSTTGPAMAGFGYVVVTVVACTGAYLLGDRYNRWTGTPEASEVTE